MRRGPGGLREELDRAWLSVGEGLPGDAWSRKLRPDPRSQLTLLRHDLAALIANGQPLSLFGDNLLVDLDLSTGHLPAGSLLRVGEALLQVTDKPHDGCRKFRSRFGADALRFVQDPATRAENRRGIHCRVVEPGQIAVGDPVLVQRP